jgi:hypothetical protein
MIKTSVRIWSAISLPAASIREDASAIEHSNVSATSAVANPSIALRR